VFHGPHGKGINIQPPSQGDSCPWLHPRHLWPCKLHWT
jgi:hypothetical protein